MKFSLLPGLICFGSKCPTAHAMGYRSVAAPRLVEAKYIPNLISDLTAEQLRVKIAERPTMQC
jgi:hypothetical protein